MARIAALFTDDSGARAASRAIVDRVGVGGVTVSRIFPGGDPGSDGLEGFLPGTTEGAERTPPVESPSRPGPAEPLAGTNTLHSAGAAGSQPASGWRQLEALLLRAAREGAVVLLLELPHPKLGPALEVLEALGVRTSWQGGQG